VLLGRSGSDTPPAKSERHRTAPWTALTEAGTVVKKHAYSRCCTPATRWICKPATRWMALDTVGMPSHSQAGMRTAAGVDSPRLPSLDYAPRLSFCRSLIALTSSGSSVG
jgi:hypothetical protein